MSSQFSIDLAGPADDAALRQILRAVPMPGTIQVSLRREPGYFPAAVVEGEHRQVIAVRDNSTGILAGFGTRSVRLLYVNGRPTPIGYLSSLRALPPYRGGTLLFRGYRFLRQLHDAEAGPALYLTTIAEDNHPARQLLTSGRAGLPCYHDWGRFLTCAIPLPTRHAPTAPEATDIHVRPGQPEDLPMLLRFFAEQGPNHQFFPVLRKDHFGSDDSMFRGLDPDDLLLAFRGGRLVGTLGLWDQRPFRQAILEGYGGHLRWTRPMVNLVAHSRGWPGLPAPGSEIAQILGALFLVPEEDPEVVRSLLTHARKTRKGGEAQFLLLGLHEHNPLLALVRPSSLISYTTRLYLVYWEDGREFVSHLNPSPPYLELGCL